MKKTLLLFIAMILAFGLCLTACGGDSGTTPDPEQQPAHSHKFGEWVTIKNANCGQDGEMARYCDCGEKQTEVIYGAGLRVSELINLKVSDLYLKENLIKVYGKGSKERMVPLNLGACICLIEYFNDVRSKLITKPGCDKKYVFLNKFGRKISRQAFNQMVDKYALKANITKNVHPHIFRHTYATNLLNNGADLRVIQELLGHSSIMTTQIYTHLAKEEIGNIYKISHPRSETN